MKILLAGLFFASIWVAVSAIGDYESHDVQAAVVENKPTTVVQSLPEVKSTPTVLPKAKTPCEAATGIRLVVIAKYGIMCTPDGHFIIPPISDRTISLSERLAVIELMALDAGVPPALLKAICWQEGWDRFTNRRCENWYEAGGATHGKSGEVVFSAVPGETIKSFDGYDLCAFQVSSRIHAKVDLDRIRTDFTYCMNQAIRILVGSARPSSNDITVWETNVRRYGPGNNQSYWPIVLSIANNPPVNPGTGQPAW